MPYPSGADWKVEVVDAGGGGMTDTELPAAVLLDDAAPNPTAPAVGAFLMVWNAATLTWRRVPSANNVLDANGGGAVPVVAVVAWDGTDFNRLRVDPDQFQLRTLAAGYTTIIDATLTRPANTTAYATGDAITDTGGTIRTLTGIARYSGGSGVIQGVLAAFSSNWVTKPALELWIYDTTRTPQADNTAFAPTDGENDTLVAIIPLNLTYVGDAAANTGNFVMDTGQISVPFKTVGSANLFMSVVVRNAAQAGANSDTLKFRFRVLQD